jgi:hypothetical protein
VVGFLIIFLSIWFVIFIARLFSLIGGRWSLFAKTYWENDLLCTSLNNNIFTIQYKFVVC